jgi:hypothetical protein
MMGFWYFERANMSKQIAQRNEFSLDVDLTVVDVDLTVVDVDLTVVDVDLTVVDVDLTAVNLDLFDSCFDVIVFVNRSSSSLVRSIRSIYFSDQPLVLIRAVLLILEVCASKTRKLDILNWFKP